MPSLAASYLSRANELLTTAWDRNASTIATLAPILGASVARGEVIHTFGSGHSELISREIIGRAGGLVCVTGIQDPTAGFIENLTAANVGADVFRLDLVGSGQRFRRLVLRGVGQN